MLAEAVALHQREALGNAGEHAQRQHVHFHQPEFVDVILVPFDEGAPCHGAIVDGHGLVEPILGQHEAADMLREMARELEDLLDEMVEPADLGIVGIEASVDQPLLFVGRGIGAPHRAREARGDVFRDAQRLADLAHRAARAEVDHRRGDAGTVAAIAFIDVLHHLLAPLVLEIDVDIGRLRAFLGDEAREQQVVLRGIDRGYAEQETDDRIGGRAAALAQDRRQLGAGEADEIVDGEEIVSVVLLADQPELFEQQLAHLGIEAGAVAAERCPHDEMDEVAQRLPAGGHRLVRIFVLQMVEREVDPREKALGFGNRLGTFREEPRHFGRGLQVPFAIGFEPASRFGDRRALADAGHHIVELAVAGLGIERVVGGDQRDTRGAGDAAQARQPAGVVALAAHRRAEPDPVGRAMREPFEQRQQARRLDQPQRRDRLVVEVFDRLGMRSLRGRGRFGQDDQQQVLVKGQQVVEPEDAVALERAQVTAREQPREPAPAMAAGRIGKNVGRAVDEDQPRADCELERGKLYPFRLGILARLAQGLVRTHHARDGVAIGHADPGHPERDRLRHQVRGLRGAVEERVAGHRPELGKGGGGDRAHAKRPWTYQSGCSASWP